jgi:hypothetical protein
MPVDVTTEVVIEAPRAVVAAFAGDPTNAPRWYRERMVMRTAQGPFPMETTYVWRSAGEGRCHMTLRNAGEPSGFRRVGSGMMAAAMRRANDKDLHALKALLEGGR